MSNSKNYHHFLSTYMLGMRNFCTISHLILTVTPWHDYFSFTEEKKNQIQGRGNDCPSQAWNGRLLDRKHLAHGTLQCDLASWWQCLWKSMEEVRRHQEKVEGWEETPTGCSFVETEHFTVLILFKALIFRSDSAK